MEESVASGFSIQENRLASKLEADIVDEVVLRNFTTIDIASQQNGLLWGGGREKHPALVQLLLQSFSKPGDVILDCNASTGIT